jgi:hypothetical protein
MKKITRILLLSLGLIMPFFLHAVEPDKPLSVAERNALQGFNDTIDRMAEDFIEVNLVIIEPSGDAMYSILGHSCLHLKCAQYGLDKFYSYVSEDIEGKVFRFLINDLRMGLVELNKDEFLQEYINEGRGVREYKLSLPPEVEMELWRICDLRVGQGLNLKYDYISRGCAISIVHSIENAINSANKKHNTKYKIEYPVWGKEFNRTLREIVYDNSPVGWNRFYGITLVGGQVDNPNLPPKEKLIIPRELLSTWQNSFIAGNPLIGNHFFRLIIVRLHQILVPFHVVVCCGAEENCIWLRRR